MIVDKLNKKKDYLRIIIGNLIIAYIVFPLLYIHNHWLNLITGNYTDGHSYYTDVYIYLTRIYNGFIFFSLMLILISLVPFQLIKNYCLYKLKRQYFLVSIIVYISLNVLVIICTGYGLVLFMKISDDKMSFIFKVLIFSVLVQTALYFLVDRFIMQENRNL